MLFNSSECLSRGCLAARSKLQCYWRYHSKTRDQSPRENGWGW